MQLACTKRQATWQALQFPRRMFLICLRVRQHIPPPHATTCPARTLWFSFPGCSCSVIDFWGWDAQGARLRRPDDGWICGARGALNLISTNYPDHGHRGRFSYSRKNAHGRAGNRTRDLMVSNQTLWPLDHEAGRYANMYDQPVTMWQKRC
jgi:hypothetical protein